MFSSLRTKQDKRPSIFYTDTFWKLLEFIQFRFLFDEPHFLQSLAPVIITILGSNSITKTSLFYCFDQINLYEGIWILFTKICLKLEKLKYLWKVLIILTGMEKIQTKLFSRRVRIWKNQIYCLPMLDNFAKVLSLKVACGFANVTIGIGGEG